MSPRRLHVLVALVAIGGVAVGDAEAARKRRGKRRKPAASARQPVEPPAPAPEPARSAEAPKGDLGLVAATIQAKLRAQPGESTALVATVPPGTRLEVLGRDGRWLRVRHGKTVGWVTRTSVAGRAAVPEAEQVSRRWRDRFTTAAEMDKVEYPGPSPAAAEVKAARPARPASSTPSTTRWRAGAGAASRSLVMTAADPAAAYRLNGLAVTAGVGVDTVFGRRAVVAADGSYGFGWGAGADVEDSSGATMATVPFSTHEVDLGLAGGVRAGGWLLLGRLGYRYEAALVDDLNNAARLPSEHLHGPTAGLRAELGLRRFWLRAGADLMFAGQRGQSAGLDDGTPDGVSALFGQLAAGYTLRSLRLDAAYRLGHCRTEWSGPSDRQPGSGGATRSDHIQTITLGASRNF